MKEGLPTDCEILTGSTVRWMLILVTCVYIITQARPTYISALNVRVCELECYKQLMLERSKMEHLP